MKVLIAEDEQWIRKGIIKSIDWETHGLELAAEALDGEEALRLAREHRPDIVLVDIRMPLCDGLQLMERLKDEGIGTKFIIISGSTQFEYARMAISLGASAYVLKPLNKSELNRILAETCRAIRQEKELYQRLASTARNEKDSSFKEGILLEMLASGSSARANRSDTAFSPFYAVLVVGVNDYGEIRCNEAAANEVKKKLLACVEKVLAAHDEGVMFERSENLYAIILGFPSNFNQAHMGIAGQVLRELHNESISVTIGAGSLYPDAANIRNAFEDALRAYKEKLIVGGGKVISAPAGQAAPISSVEDHLSPLCMAVELSDSSEIRFRCQAMLSRLMRNENFNYETIYKWVSRIKSMVSVMAESYGIDDTDDPDLNELLYLEGVQSLLEFLVDSLRQLAGRISAAKDAAGLQTAQAAIDFIHVHYAEEITLDTIAKHVNLHPNYLSEMFKRKVGVNFIDYLVNFRIEKAKMWMAKHPELGIGKIAEMVGYANPRYFSSLFAKRTGMKPTEYRQYVPETRRSADDQTGF